jgi:uncharacterized protein YjeT (DUF2065 family)
MGDPGDSRDGGRARGTDRAGAIVAEIADAFGAALTALAEEQGIGLADRTSAIGEAVRSAARSLDGSNLPGLARNVDQAAERIDDIARLVRERCWREFAAETAGFARRRPRLFGLGAIAIGFLAGRLMAAKVGEADAVGRCDREPR